MARKTKASVVSKTLTTRSKTHGEFHRVAETAQSLKDVLHGVTRYYGALNLSASMVEALDMISSKEARIVCGDPYFEDHWLDIAGYAILVYDELVKQKAGGK